MKRLWIKFCVAINLPLLDCPSCGSGVWSREAQKSALIGYRSKPGSEWLCEECELPLSQVRT